MPCCTPVSEQQAAGISGPGHQGHIASIVYHCIEFCLTPTQLLHKSMLDLVQSQAKGLMAAAVL